MKILIQKNCTVNNTTDKYLQAICHALGLPGDSGGIPPEKIALACRWAAGAEYRPEPYEARALQPVLATLKNRKTDLWMPPVELSLESSFFPTPEKPNSTDLEKRLADLKKSLASATPQNRLTCLQYHASTLAVSESLPDLPLYDFIKTAGAILHCLDHGKGQLRLAGGSISGIQSYLYDIVSKRAGKLLKGRSFYLQLLTDSLTERFLETFVLSDAHIVYSSGGGFYVLMPDYDEVFGKFEDFRSEVIKQIYKRHGINLTCEFALSESFDENADTPKIWDELLQKLQESKTQRLSHNLALLEDLLYPIEQGGLTVRDEITNEEITDPDDVDYIGRDDDQITVKKSTKQQVEVLGKNLKSAKYWATAQQDVRATGDWFTDPLGYQHRLFSQKPNEVNFKELNEVNATNPFAFYGGNKTPLFTEENIQFADSIETEVGDPITFDALAHAEKGATLNRLGILRMDVDNLGKIFSDDIGSPASFARYAAVSRSLDWFFKGYLNTIHGEVCEASGQKFSERTVIIYSGGDDLFIVGRWLETLEMACRIRKEFKKWSGGNLSISGGVAILPDKFPVMQGANLAGEKEKSAKNYLLDGQKLKNAVCFFDQTLNWENEIPVVEELKKMLERWLAAGVDNSILKKIDQHAKSRKEQEKYRESPRWIWNMVYDFGRFSQKRGLELLAPEIRELAKRATLEDFEFKQKKRAVPFLYLLQTAARWVELERRTLLKD